MGRRRKDPLEEIIPTLGVLVILGIIFVPGFKVYLYLFLGFPLLALASFLFYRFLKSRTR